MEPSGVVLLFSFFLEVAQSSLLLPSMVNCSNAGDRGQRTFPWCDWNKMPICIYLQSGTGSITVELPVGAKDVIGYDQTEKRFHPPKTFQIETSRRDLKNFCVYLVFLKERRYEISACLQQDDRHIRVYFEASVIPLSSLITRDNIGSNHLEVPLHQLVLFRVQVLKFIETVSVQIQFGDDVTNQHISKNGTSEFLHAYQNISTYNVLVIIAYSSEQSPQTLVHRFPISVISKQSDGRGRRGQKRQSGPARSLHEWQFTRIGTQVARVECFTAERPCQDDTRIGCLMTKQDLRSKDFPTQSLSSSYLFSSAVYMGPYRENLIVIDKEFTIFASVSPIGEIFDYAWSTRNGNAIIVSEDGYLATFKAIRGGSVTITVRIDSTINWVSKSYVRSVDRQFDRFSVEYSSNSHFQFGSPINVKVQADGLDDSNIRYTLTCGGQRITSSYKSGFTVFMDATLPTYGNISCELVAHVGFPYLVIHEYCAPGVTPVDRQYILSRNIMQRLTYIMRVNETAVMSNAIETSQIFTLELICDGVGARLRVEFQGAVVEQWPEWDQIESVTKSVFELSSEEDGSYEILLSAWNYVSNKSTTYNVSFFSRITDFEIKTPEYVIKNQAVILSLSNHNGSSVIYTWYIEGVSIGIVRNDTRFGYTFNSTGEMKISVLAENQVSSNNASRLIYVYEDLTGVSWGNTYHMETKTTNKTFPVNLTVHSGLPVLLSIKAGTETIMNDTVAPSVYHVLYHAFDSPGEYDIRAVASSLAGTRIELSQVISVENEVRGVVAEWTTRSATVCVPSYVEIYASAEQGTNVYCNISTNYSETDTMQALQDDVGRLPYCRGVYKLLDLGTYQFSTTMFNSVSAQSAVTSSITGIHSSRRTFEFSFISGFAKIGTDSILRINNVFDCPLPLCKVDFGDGSRLQVLYQVQNDTAIPHKYPSVGLFVISGSCSSHNETKHAIAEARVINPLVITEVYSEKECVAEGRPYVIQTKFMYRSEKVWGVRVNSTVIGNLTGVVFDDGLSAAIRIGSDFYGKYGNSTVELTISDALDEKVIFKQMCVLKVMKLVYLTVPRAAEPYQIVNFYVESRNVSSVLSITLAFGDGSQMSSNLQTPLHVISKRYMTLGHYNYTWQVTSPIGIQTGSGMVKTMWRILVRYWYEFRTETDLFYWPDSEVKFYYNMVCINSMNEPTDAFYRVMLADGTSITDWLPLPSRSCIITNILTHRFEKSGCFRVMLHMKNLLGYSVPFTEIKVARRFKMKSVSIESVPPARRVVEMVADKEVVHLRKADPFRVITNITGGNCRTYDYIILNPWHRWIHVDKDMLEISILLGMRGTYDLRLIIKSQFSWYDKVHRFKLVDSILGLQLLASEPDQGRFVSFYLLVLDPGASTNFTWHFSTETEFTESNPAFTAATALPGIAMLNEANKIVLERYVGLMKRRRYENPGSYSVTVTATDPFVTLHARKTVYISGRPCKRPIVKILLGSGRSRLEYSVLNSFTTQSDIQIDCEESNMVVFSWSLYKSGEYAMARQDPAEDANVISFGEDVITNQREIAIQKSTLEPGVYKLKLEATMDGIQFSGSDEVFLVISTVPIAAKIAGGVARLLPLERGIFLDGSQTHDPNILNGNNKDLKYSWYCKVKPGTVHFVIGKGGCFGHGNGLIEHRSETWMIPAETFIMNGIYEMTLIAESRTVEGRNGTYVQSIEVREGPIMITSVQCQINCKDRVDVGTTVSLLGRCDGCGEMVTYDWKLLDKLNLTVLTLRWLVDTRTPRDSISFVFNPSILTKNTAYVARFTASSPLGYQGYSDYDLQLSVPPFGGFCNVTPASGEAVKTEFRIACFDWITDTSTLKYSMSLIKVSASSGLSESTLLSHSFRSYTIAKLPEGPHSENYNQRIEIRVVDSYGVGTLFNTTAQVLPFTVEQNVVGETPLETELETYVHGDNSTLTKLVGSGDVQGLTRFTTSIGKSLDSAKHEKPEDSTHVKEDRKEKREKMREKLVNTLTDVKITTLENFALVNSALERVSITENEVSKTSQDKMLSFFDSGTRVLEKSYESWNQRDPKLVQDALTSLLEGVGNVMESAVTSRSATQGQEKEDYLKFTSDAMKVLENSTLLLFRSIAVNEIAKRISSDSIAVEVKKAEGATLDTLTVQTLDGGKFSTPSGQALFGVNNTNKDVIEVKVVSLSKNPYTWDKEGIGNHISPSISSAKFVSNGADMKVESLPAGDEAVMEIITQDIQPIKRNDTLKASQSLVYVTTLPLPGLAVMLKARCVGSPCRVYATYPEKPTFLTSETSFYVEDSENSSRDSPFVVFNDVQSTVFNVGVRTISTNSSTLNETEFFLEMFTTGCFYWDESGEKWKTDGCKVSSESTLQKTVCKCDHLTWFGAGFVVQPNLIDVKKEILKIRYLADYPALLATVCVIGGLYLIAMVWARRQDKNDVLKASLIIAEDCCQTHKFRYEVTIYTGSRPGSGTSSSVCIILGGQNGESDPHCLSIASEVMFQRGSVDSFLVTSAEDLGALSWIRAWHDSTGTSPSWYLSRIIVVDILKGTQTTFICHTWLGIGIEDGKIDKTFIAVEGELSKDFETLFLAKTSRGFSDDHLWFSIILRPPRSHFTRCQRVSCCLSALLCTMLANAMFYQRRGVAGTEVKLGSFSFSWSQIAIGVESALVVIPINLLIVNLFRRAAPLFQNTADSEDAKPRPSDTGTAHSVSLHEHSIRIMVTDANEPITGSLAKSGSTNYPFMDVMSQDTLNLIQTLNELENDECNTLHFVNSITSRVSIREGLVGAEDTSINIYPTKAERGSGITARGGLLAPNAAGHVTKVPHFTTQRDTLPLEMPAPRIYGGTTVSKTSPISTGASTTTKVKTRLDQALMETSFQPSWDENERLLSKGDIFINLDTESFADSTLLVDEFSTDALELLTHLNNEPIGAHLNIEPDVLMEILHKNSETVLEDNDKKKKKSAISYWPHWCMYVAWVLCVLTTTTSGFFTLLYGLSFGRVVQEEWLVSFFTSIFQDVFVSQPSKVIVIGCVFAFILRKLSEDEKLPEVELLKDTDWVKAHLPLQEKRATGSRIKVPLTESYVHKAHLNRLKQMKMTDVTLEIVVYFFYILLALLIAYGHRSPNAHGMGENINSMFVTDKFDKITSVNDFWEWIDNSFLPSMYGEKWYNGDTTSHKGFLADYVTYRIGSPRLRQVRVVQEPCKITGTQYKIDRKECHDVFDRAKEDKSHYSTGWTKNGSKQDTFIIRNKWEDPWLYNTDSQLHGHTFVSQINSYPGGGYVRTLGTTSHEANTSISYLKKHLWLDTLTRALFIEFTTYNNNDNFYCIVTMVLEFNPDGGATPFTKVYTTRLDRYNSEFSFFLAACEISFLLLTLYYMWLEFKEFRKKGYKYFREVGTILEIFSFAVTWAAFALLLIRLGVVKWTKNKYKEDTEAFTTFQYAGSSDLAYGYALATVVVIAFLKVLRILRFNKNMLILFKTLQYASEGLKYYSIFFSIAFTAFIQWGHLCFGRHLSGYATMVRSSMSLMNLLLGSPQFYELQDANRVVGPIFFTLFIFTVTFVLMNLFLSIIMDAFAAVRKEMAGQPNQYELLDFLYERLTSFFPCLQLSTKQAELQLSEEHVEKYYEKRLKQRKVLGLEENDLRSADKAMEKMDDFINRLLLSEYHEIDELARVTLKVKSKSTLLDSEAIEDNEDGVAKTPNIMKNKC